MNASGIYKQPANLTNQPRQRSERIIFRAHTCESRARKVEAQQQSLMLKPLPRLAQSLILHQRAKESFWPRRRLAI